MPRLALPVNQLGRTFRCGRHTLRTYASEVRVTVEGATEVSELHEVAEGVWLSQGRAAGRGVRYHPLTPQYRFSITCTADGRDARTLTARRVEVAADIVWGAMWDDEGGGAVVADFAWDGRVGRGGQLSFVVEWETGRLVDFAVLSYSDS